MTTETTVAGINVPLVVVTRLFVHENDLLWSFLP